MAECLPQPSPSLPLVLLLCHTPNQHSPPLHPKMALSSQIYSALFKRNSVFVGSIFFGAFAFGM